MNDLSSQTPYLVIVAVVAVVAIVTLLIGSNSTLEGAVSAEPGCVQNYDVLDPNTPDSVTANGVTRRDFCEGDNTHQWECSNDKIAKQVRAVHCQLGCNQATGACCTTKDCF
ncbi:MAG TPA: hypothetical protein VJI98_01775 [Candidatus Nanoarchaeia archaeon]|nr:hypothetical protein [Candidatus Nanoarchaeia archaeon]